MEVSPGEIGLCVREENHLVSKCSFSVPEGTGRALVIVMPDADKDQYTTHVVDAGKQAFVKGKTLLINSGSVACKVKLGGMETEAKPGETLVEEPAIDANGMYQMVVIHQDKSGNVVTCFDRFIAANTETRDFLFLIPDANMVVRAVSMSDFGPFE